jgi:hypothetical protein
MSGNRLFELLRTTGQSQQPAPSAFMMVPVAVQTSLFGWEQVYRRAYEQAQAVARPSILDRLSANLEN